MAQAAKAQEPSMEEILASIRRIIADDETKAPPPRAAAPPSPPAAAPRPPPPPAAPRAVVPPPPPPTPIPPPSPVSSEVDSLIAAAEPPAAAEILDLTESMAAPDLPPAAFRTIDGQSDIVFAEASSAPEPQPQSELAPSRVSERLLSGAASAAVDSAFNSLAQTVLVNNARTLEDLVREILRPMLKSWLDDNLPGVVERLVRAEIERVSRGRS